MATELLTGNFNKTASEHRGWVIGNFMDKQSPFCTKNFEVKWGKHKKGESKGTVTQTNADSLAILVYGKHAIKFPSLRKEIVLEKEGDYLFFPRGVDHTWETLEDTLMLTIRWPSIPPEKDDKINH